MTRSQYREHLMRLSDDELAHEVARRLSYYSPMSERERGREVTAGMYGLCWEECCARGTGVWARGQALRAAEVAALAEHNRAALERIEGRAASTLPGMIE